MQELTTYGVVGGDRRAWDRRLGGALPVVIMVMIVISVLGMGLLHLAAQDGMETSRSLRAKQCFWLAEAGLAESRVRVVRQMPVADPVSRTLDQGAYIAWVTLVQETNVTIVSTGMVHGATRVIRQELTLHTNEWPWAILAYGLAGFSGTCSLWNNVLVSGKVYHAESVVLQNNGSVVGDIVTAESGDVTADNNSAFYGWEMSPVPPPEMPPLDTTYYDALIQGADLPGAQNMTLGSTNLAGATVCVNGTLSVGNNATIGGRGVLVAAGDIVLENGASLGTNLTLISGGVITLRQNVTMGSNALLFARTGVVIENNGVVITAAMILTPGFVNVSANAVISGVVYAGGEAVLNNNATLRGSLVAGVGPDVGNSTVIHDASAYPPPPPGLGTNYLRSIRWEVVGGS